MERPTKEQILREIRRLADENDGVPVGKLRFESLTGITESAWSGHYWARWADAVREAGYEANAWQTQVHDDDSLARTLALLVREYGYFPTAADLRLRRKVERDTPNDKVFFNRFGNKSKQIARVLAFADANAEFADVAAICGPLVSSTKMPPSSVAGTDAPPVTGVVYMIRMDEFYKVGRSNDLDRRTRELRTQLPVKGELVHTIETDDPSGIEAYWHRRFASRRANGEWFRLLPDDVTAFQRRAYM